MPTKSKKPRHTSKRRLELPTKFTPRVLKEADQRFWLVKEMKRRIEDLQADADCHSTQRQILAGRAAFLWTVIESWECDHLEGKELPYGRYVQAMNALLGLLRSLGLDKTAGDSGSLADYMEKAGAD